MAKPETDVRQLNSFLRGEMSAVETYKQAIDKVDDSRIRSELVQCKSSHERRVLLLRDYIRTIGGQPAEGSGVWGAFAKLVEGGAKAFGEKATLSALEEGENHGRNDYERDLGDLSAEVRQFVTTKVVPEQQSTHATLSRLQHAI